MKKPEHSRPFNLEHAKAGAPYCCRDGDQAEILKWDARVPDHQLIGCIGPMDAGMAWTASGYYRCDVNGRPKDLVMLPIGMCEGKPVFMGDELVTRFGDKFVVTEKHIHDLDEENTWPIRPPVYPNTRLSYAEMEAAYLRNGEQNSWNSASAINLANAAIARAIQDGDVVLPTTPAGATS